MATQKTIKRFIAGFYSGDSCDIMGHGKTLSEALTNLKMRNMARAAKFEAEYSMKRFGYINIVDEKLAKTAVNFGETYQQECTFICQELTEHYYDYENQLSNIVEEKDIKLKYPLKWV